MTKTHRPTYFISKIRRSKGFIVSIILNMIVLIATLLGIYLINGNLLLASLNNEHLTLFWIPIVVGGYGFIPLLLDIQRMRFRSSISQKQLNRVYLIHYILFFTGIVLVGYWISRDITQSINDFYGIH